MPEPDAGSSFAEIQFSAFLVLSHGAFWGAAIAASAVSITIYLLLFTVARNTNLPQRVLAVAVGWNVVSVLISAWTVFAIASTWRSAARLPANLRIFGNGGFGFLLLVTLLIASANLWTLAEISIDVCCRRRSLSSSSRAR